MSRKVSDRLVEYFTILCENNVFPPVETKIVEDCKILETDLTSLHDVSDWYDWAIYLWKEVESELDFIHKEYGSEKNDNLTKDALWLKMASLKAELNSTVEAWRKDAIRYTEEKDKLDTEIKRLRKGQGIRLEEMERDHQHIREQEIRLVKAQDILKEDYPCYPKGCDGCRGDGYHNNYKEDCEGYKLEEALK